MSTVSRDPRARFAAAIAISLLANAVIWTAVGTGLTYRISAPLPPIEFQRVVIDNRGRKVVKVVKPEEVKRKVQRIVHEPPPKPVVHHVAPPPPTPHAPPPRPTHALPPPQGAHNRVLTAPRPSGAPKPTDFDARPDGNAKLGQPTEAQAPGNAVVNPPVPPKTETPAPTAPPPPQTPPPPAQSTNPPAEKPPVEKPPVETPKEPPPPPQKPKGPTQKAQPVSTVEPEIPDELKSQDFKSFVRVKVDIAADGTFTVVLRTSSGNEDVDKRVLEALKKWKWKPALAEGQPVDSTQLFRFEFEVK